MFSPQQSLEVDLDQPHEQYVKLAANAQEKLIKKITLKHLLENDSLDLYLVSEGWF